MEKELKEVLSAIRKWNEKNKGETCFVGSFVSFNPKKDEAVKDAIIVGFGGREEIELSLKDITETVKKEKGDFINI